MRKIQEIKMIIFILFFSSIIEEIIFRKILFDYFTEKFKSRKKSIIFISILFFIMHKFSLKMLFLTTTLAFVKYKKNSTILCILIHIFYNMCLYFLYN